MLAALEGLVAEERQAVLGHQWQQAAQEPERYRFVARRALQQMEVGNLAPQANKHPCHLRWGGPARRLAGVQCGWPVGVDLLINALSP